MKFKALFIGITAVDLQYLVDAFPQVNLKTNSSHFHLSPGGPATNAAVAFAYLSGHSTLYSAIGRHPFTGYIRQELKSYEIDIVDLLPNSSVLPTFSSIITTKSSGERSVVTFTAGKTAAAKIDLPQIEVGAFDILLVDGFYMPVSQLIAARAREKAVPVVLDGGSWKKGMESLLKFMVLSVTTWHG